MLTVDERIRKIGEFKSIASESPERLSGEANAILHAARKIEDIKLDRYLIPKIEAMRGCKTQDIKGGKRHFSFLVLKPVGARCNLSCSYCYHSSVDKDNFKRYSYLKENTVIGAALIERIIKQAADFLCGNIEIDWHGGEPLLAGIDFYKMAVRIQKRYCGKDIKIKNCIQTNATLINDEWVRFFKKHNFRVGLSIDGARENHDLHRFYAPGKGSYNDVIRNLKKLKTAGVRFGSICVISPLHKKHAGRLIENFIDAGIDSVKIHPSNHPDLTLPPGEYADYMIDIFETWLSNYGEKISISLFSDIFYVLLGLRLPNCHGRCGQVLLSFEPNGDVWLCDWPFGCEKYRFGNILEMDLGAILNSENYINFLKTKSKINKGCGNCQWYLFCQGGCTYFRTFKNGRVEDGVYDCAGMKRIFKYVTNRFDKILEENGKDDTAPRKRIPVKV